MDIFNFIHHPILIAGYSICLLILILTFIKQISFRYILMIVLFVLLVGLTIFALLNGSSYEEVIIFNLIYLIIMSLHLLKKKEVA